MRVVVLVPRRSDGGRRDHLWSYLAARWATECPDWPVFEGHHDDGGAFNRSAAINAAASAAGDWDVAILADSDTFVGTDQLHAAVQSAARTGRITFAYDRFAYLSRRMSDRVMEGYQGNWWDGVVWTMPGTCSSMVVVTRQLFDAVGGFDEGFVGWGGEDVAFSLSCQALGDGFDRITGDVWHLYHDPAPHTHDHEWPHRVSRYAQCDGNPELITRLLHELGVIATPEPAPAKPKKAAAKRSAGGVVSSSGPVIVADQGHEIITP